MGGRMSDPKSLTELSLRKRRQAYQARTPYGPSCEQGLEREAAELLVLEQPPDVGPGGEVVMEQTAGLPEPRRLVRETLAEGADRIAEDASIGRTDLLMQPGFNAVAMGIDAAESIGAANSLEKMLAHEMAVAHELAMRMAGRALSVGQDSGDETTETCRLANAAARLMKTFQDGLLTLHKIRSDGSQTVTVQHVNVAPGAQAVIGNVRTGGSKSRGHDEKNG